VAGGQAVQISGVGAIQQLALPNEDEFDQWCATRDQRIRSFRSAQYVNRYIPGVEDLDTYGTWQIVAEYGPVWYPAGVPIGWVPYRFGHWVWIEPWGWTWVEDEAWGFCAFHFGRWALIAGVWGWVPGPLAVVPFYAPALVAFLGGGFSIGVDVQAWFPLGPRDPFIPWYHYGPNYLREVNITNIRNVTNIENIINVRNINNIHYAYKDVATTVVPTDVFRSGQPVVHHVVHVPPQQLARAQVAPHPSVAPAATAAFGGRRPTSAPIARTRPGMPAANRARPVSPAHPVSPMTRASQPGAPIRPGAPINRNLPAGRSALHSPASEPAPHFMTRLAPPPHDVPFADREPALSAHPGRPLEPQQALNLREGRPAGPMRDVEIPHPHEWVTRPAPAPRPAQPPRPAPRRHAGCELTWHIQVLHLTF
jgi:hypothetical protein